MQLKSVAGPVDSQPRVRGFTIEFISRSLEGMEHSDQNIIACMVEGRVKATIYSMRLAVQRGLSRNFA